MSVADRPLPLREKLPDRVISVLLNWGLYVALAAMFLFFSLASPYFLAPRNLLNIGEAMSVTGIIAAGLTVVIIAGQLDLSVGSMIGFTACIMAVLIAQVGLPSVAVIPVIVAVALGVGLLNGALVVNLGINSIIGTLATSTVIRGLSFILVIGQVVPVTTSEMQRFINSKIGGIPLTFMVMVLTYVIILVMLNYSRLGYHIYATGGNREGARRAGINTDRVTRIAFLISAFLAMVGGFITMSRNAAGQATYGTGAELDILTAVLLGGIGLSGGQGRVERTLVGVLFIGVLNNGLVLLNVPSFYQYLARGIAFLLAVVLDALRAKRASR